ncbi:golgin subfamily A member 6-like protein 22 [Clytia hemisphaerica]|uniref:golgin subfamily A member 6-like protein 22 n=1 Tax=Clytia hemisphaerica TaxID=252671 RepID=UPI0034D68868
MRNNRCRYQRNEEGFITLSRRMLSRKRLLKTLKERKARVDALKNMFSEQVKAAIQREKFISERISELKTIKEKTKLQADQIKTQQQEISALNQEIVMQEQQMDVVKDVLFKQEKVLNAQDEFILQEEHRNQQCEEILKLREEQIQIFRQELKRKEELLTKVNNDSIVRRGLDSNGDLVCELTEKILNICSAQPQQNLQKRNL